MVVEMIRLSGKLTPGKRAYALVCPEIPGEAPERVIFGWAHDLARLVLGWKLSSWLPKDSTVWSDEERDEAAATIEAIQDPRIDAWGYKLAEAHHLVAQEAAWGLDLEDIQPFYEGPETQDEYQIREWCERFITDLSVRHTLLDGLVEVDKDLSPALVAQIRAQMDEEG